VSKTPLILVVDDNQTIRRLVEFILGQSGYRLSMAENGMSGLALAAKLQPDLILLDYVLPDLDGGAVCEALMRADRTVNLPVVIMSSKGNEVRMHFGKYPQVVDFIQKPFSPPELLNLIKGVFQRLSGFRVSQALPAITTTPGSPASATGVQPALAAPRELFSPEQKNVAAQALYQALREGLSAIPQMMDDDYAGENPAPYFAKRLLSPDAVDGILDGLLPVYQEAVAAPPAPVSEKSPGFVEEPGAVISGQTALMPLPKLMHLICDLGRTGELSLVHGQRTTTCLIRKGDLVIVSHDQIDEYLSGCDEVGQVDPQARERAEREVKRNGKPVLVSYAETGQLKPMLLQDLLHRQGRRALLEALSAGPGRFVWRERTALPAWVEAAGRTLHLDQAELERLRSIDDWTQVEAQVKSVGQLFRRSADFLARLPRFEFTSTEHRVLARIDGRHTVQQVIERCGVPTFEVFHILYRLTQVHLIESVGETASGVQEAIRARPVMIYDGDQEGVCKPLSRLLRDRAVPVPLLAILPASDFIAAISKEKPGLVLINSAGIDAAAIAQGVRRTLKISDVPLAAILEQPSEEDERNLLAAGFDAVLTKPLHLRDIDRLLAGTH
jgi:DNA-binding response OmpR family regulator